MRSSSDDEKIVIGGNRNASSVRQLQRTLGSMPRPCLSDVHRDDEPAVSNGNSGVTHGPPRDATGQGIEPNHGGVCGAPNNGNVVVRPVAFIGASAAFLIPGDKASA